MARQGSGSEQATPVVVVKAQIHAEADAAREAAIKVVKTLEAANEASKAILGDAAGYASDRAGRGKRSQRLLIEEGSAIERELYLGLVLDRASAKVVFMASQAGGMEIEEVAVSTRRTRFARSTSIRRLDSSLTRRANWRSSWGSSRPKSTTL